MVAAGVAIALAIYMVGDRCLVTRLLLPPPPLPPSVFAFADEQVHDRQTQSS